jgi:hypothetical protein
MGEHLAGYLSGAYTTYDAEALSHGEHRAARIVGDQMWPQTLQSFLRDFEQLAPNLIALVRMIRFHLAPLEGDSHLHNRVEGMIGRFFRRHSRPDLRNFLMPGLQLPAAVPYDEPIRLMISSEVPIAGLSSEITE